VTSLLEATRVSMGPTPFRSGASLKRAKAEKKQGRDQTERHICAFSSNNSSRNLMRPGLSTLGPTSIPPSCDLLSHQCPAHAEHTFHQASKAVLHSPPHLRTLSQSPPLPSTPSPACAYGPPRPPAPSSHNAPRPSSILGHLPLARPLMVAPPSHPPCLHHTLSPWPGSLTPASRPPPPPPGPRPRRGCCSHPT
jgi:hypothetical protein